MVSLWPWKGDTSSPASFEKALSKLSTQISSATLSLESTHSRARRIKALWTLYTTLTYLLYSLVITLVLGPRRWAAPHYAGLAGAPLIIYAVRRGVTMFFDWRTASQQSYLEELQKQREVKITQLKKATKYDSTQELLQKYGGGSPKSTPSKPQQQSQQGTKRKTTPVREPGRTGLPPPPTANIPGRITGSSPSTPQRSNLNTRPDGSSSPQARSPLSRSVPMDSPADVLPEEPGFAPNAFSYPPPPRTQSRPAYEHPPRWYDRILDVLLGEDETLPKNRVALLCSNCRLVNGQAPPGVKSLEEIGRWRCGGCGGWNGIENEAAKVVQEIRSEGENDRGAWDGVSKDNERKERKEKVGRELNEVGAAVDEAPGEAEEDEEEKTPNLEGERIIPDSEGEEDEADVVGDPHSESGSDKEDAVPSGPKRVTRSTSKQKKTKNR